MSSQSEYELREEHPADKIVYISDRYGVRREQEYDTLHAAMEAAYLDNEWGEAYAIGIVHSAAGVLLANEQLFAWINKKAHEDDDPIGGRLRAPAKRLADAIGMIEADVYVHLYRGVRHGLLSHLDAAGVKMPVEQLGADDAEGLEQRIAYVEQYVEEHYP